ncbi:MAG: SufD family Fe-S cluster assembly protein [Candidatus Methanomethylicia archaeon]
MSLNKSRRIEEVKGKAKEALTKPPSIGPDIDVSKFKFESKPLEHVTDDLAQRASIVGVDLNGRGRAGTYIQIDHSPLLEKSMLSDVEVMSIGKALEEYDWLLEYYWNALNVDTDKFTALAELKRNEGFFVRVRRGVKVELPVQTCLYLRTSKLSQNLHNIILVEEDSELHVVTGCASPRVAEGLHVGVSEFYVKNGGKLTYTMVHAWAEDVDVRPRTGVILEDNASFISIYVNLHPVRTLQMMPKIRINGVNSRVSLISVITASGKSYFDVGGEVYIKGDFGRAEIVSKTIAKDNGKAISRGVIIGEGRGVKGHLECRGIMLTPSASIIAIPQLEARSRDVELTHEAAIGKIAEDEIYYLVARGFSEEEATSIILRGFMDIDIKDLPPILVTQIKKTLDIVAKTL